MTTETAPHWGADAVDPHEHNLPSLKASFLLKHVPRAGRLVEVGCGEGKILRTLARRAPSLELYGCDVRTPAVAPDGYAFRLMDRDVPFEDDSMDVVVLFDVVEHVPDPARLFSESARVLRPLGHLLACVPIEGELLSFYELFRRLLGRDTYAITKEHIQAFTHRSIRTLILERFDLVDVEYAYHAIGQFMDAAFFAAARAKKLRDFWWKDNIYYNADKRDAGGGVAVMNRLLVAGNAVAWAESTLLASTPRTSACVLVHAVARG